MAEGNGVSFDLSESRAVHLLMVRYGQGIDAVHVLTAILVAIGNKKAATGGGARPTQNTPKTTWEERGFFALFLTPNLGEAKYTSSSWYKELSQLKYCPPVTTLHPS
jgi:hypothetical protein